ncbi:MAG: hypothetical protein R3C12_22215 [Planctomycetaceae bacterium]
MEIAVGHYALELGADNKTEEVIKLINSEMLIVAGFNDLLGTSHRSIADFWRKSAAD